MRHNGDGSYLLSPTDLVSFLGCHHAALLDLRSLTQTLVRDEASESDELLRRKGLAHETKRLQLFKDDGKRVVEIDETLSASERRKRTIAAMEKGAEVIYQAALFDGCWGGYADFLVRTARPSRLGDYSYEAIDTKLSQHPEVSHLLQLSIYSDALATVQGGEPDRMHLILGDGHTESFRVGDFAYYVRHARRRLENFVQAPPKDSYPEPCAHCDYCHWLSTCTAQWQKDDHLSLVANIRKSQIVTLRGAGVNTVAGLAQMSPGVPVPNLNPDSLERLRHQAALQDHKRRTGDNKVELIPCEPGRGFARLPQSDAGDLFFDMEGDPYHPNGLEYLFGVYFQSNGEWVFRAFWAHDHHQEQIALSDFMAFLDRRLVAHPTAHIYHYNVYETEALKWLAARYAVAEEQLDNLLRGRKFVDLYKVVREAIRVSEPSYSLKNLETFYMGTKRGGGVTTAADSIVVYNRWRDCRDDQLLEEISDYNEADCVSTYRLREWLLTLRPPETPWFSKPEPATDLEETLEPDDKRKQLQDRYADYQRRLLEAMTGGANQGHGRLADLLGFHDRERKPQWWDVFARQDKDEDELLDDPECLARLTLVGEPTPVKRSLVHTFRFPPQETKRTAGETVVDVASLDYAGSIEEIVEGQGLVRLKRGAKSGPLPPTLTIGPGVTIKTAVLRDAIFRVAEDLLAGRDSYPALHDILNRALPRIRGLDPGRPIARGDHALREVVDALTHLDNSYLFIQGPPGCGKTYTAAHAIVQLIRAGKRIGVAANSHKAIGNLLQKVEELAAKQGVSFAGVKKGSVGDDSVFDGRCIRTVTANGDISTNDQLLAGTAWLFADPRLDRQLDYLFIDEAGQVALANVVAMGTAARNLVLIGDQMQLGQPVQAVHPAESGASVLDFLLCGLATVPADRGIFLAQTRRMRPALCRYISDAFYEGRLDPHTDTAKRRLIFTSPIANLSDDGVHFLPVPHAGCTQRSAEEAAAVKRLYDELLRQQFVDRAGVARPMTTDDILVVSPYNVQVNYLKSVLPAGARVGTVDKFQGQEAAVVLVSMATSTAEDMPRGVEFLFSANRLNVAVSRAQCLAVVLANPGLLETSCRTVEQLRLVNKFCQLAAWAADSRPA
jgi:predicted RecB family nuclease